MRNYLIIIAYVFGFVSAYGQIFPDTGFGSDPQWFLKRHCALEFFPDSIRQSNDSVEIYLLQEINEYRVSNGLNSLKSNDTISSFSRMWSKKCLENFVEWNLKINNENCHLFFNERLSYLKHSFNPPMTFKTATEDVFVCGHKILDSLFRGKSKKEIAHYVFMEFYNSPGHKELYDWESRKEIQIGCGIWRNKNKDICVSIQLIDENRRYEDPDPNPPYDLTYNPKKYYLRNK